MAEIVLCDEGLQVSLDGGGDRTLVSVRGEATLRFWADTSHMEDALRGEPVQLSTFGGYCRIEALDGLARLEFALEGSGRKSCAFPIERLAEALAHVRSLPSPEVPPSDIVVETD